MREKGYTDESVFVILRGRLARGDLIGDPKIDALDLRVVRERRSGTFEHGAASLQDIGVVGDVECERD
jgi:hypothetical protein